MVLHILSTNPDWIQTICRVILGVIFFAHGAQKVFGWFEGPGLKQAMRTMTEHLGLPALLAFSVVGGEFLGGVALIIGLLSRLAAAAGIVILMVVAILMVHGRYGLFLNWFGDQKGHGYEYHLLAIAVAIVIMVRGSGALSLDRLFTS